MSAKPLIAYFAHHLEDPAYRRRVAMLEAGGADVVVLVGFARERPALEALGNVPVHVLGYTKAANFMARIRSVLAATLRIRSWATRIKTADIILARNLECLALAVLGAWWNRLAAPIHYEVLDIHRLMLRQDIVGQGIRKVEHLLMRRCATVVVSSPAFVTEYFDRFQPSHPPVVLIENKVFPSQTYRPQSRQATLSPKLRIGWFGNIRCRKSLRMLKALAESMTDRVVIDIRGTVASTDIPDFDELIGDIDNVHFHGRYTYPDDLSRIYGEVDIAWAIDFFEEGQNSMWLLPNRLYESCLFGCIPMALKGTETARWMQGHGLGMILPQFTLETLTRLLGQMTPANLAESKNALAENDSALFECTKAECRALIERLCTRPDKIPQAQHNTSITTHSPDNRSIMIDKEKHS